MVYRFKEVVWLFERLKSFGYALRVKEIKRFGRRTKANCDVDLTMDVLLKIKEYKRAIILSGDGDFAPWKFEIFFRV
jgi:uncharacterized LabA/DUF88 family protein